MKSSMIPAVLALLLLGTASRAHADLILALQGTVGSNVVQYTASDSVTIGIATIADDNSGVSRAPVAGIWNDDFDENLGNFLRNGMDTSMNDDLALTGGGISYRRNGVEFAVLNTIDLDGSNSSGGDDVELDPTASVDYPALTIGDVLSWEGSGTFTLEDGETFDTLFVQTGTFTESIDGGNFVLQISLAAIPEPSSALLLASVVSMLGFYRRRANA